MSRPSSLRHSLLWVLAAALAPLALLAVGLVAYQWTQERNRHLEGLQAQARVLRDAIDRELTLDVAVLHALGASRDLDRGDMATFYEVAGRTARVRRDSWVILVDAAGQNLLNTAVPFGTALPDLRKSLAQGGTVPWQGRQLPLPALDLFDRPLRTGEPAFSGLVYGRISQRPVVATNVPVLRDGRASHVLGMAYAADFYAQLLRTQVPGPAHVATLVDGGGRVIARNRSPERFVGVQAPTPFGQGTAGLSPDGMGQTVNLEGELTDYAYSRSRVADWAVAVGIPRSTLLAPARHALWASAAIVLATLALAAVVALRLARRIAAPLSTLADHARTGAPVAGDGPSSGIREVEALREAMVAAAAAQAQRRRSEAEREAAAGELARAHEQLLDSQRRKDEFLATLSHELRNPLAAIGNAAHLLARLPETDRVRARMHEILVRQTAHLGRLLDDLLDVARATHGKMALSTARLQLDALAHRAAQDIRPALDAKGLALAVQAPQPVAVVADGVRLAQVLNNLLDNAAKYTPAGGAIVLQVAAEDGQAVLRVRDTGSGIPAELLPRVFETFTQSPQTIDRSQGGLGLGLAIVQRIVALHGGTVVVRSEGDGRGTEVEVRLPLAPPDAGG